MSGQISGMRKRLEEAREELRKLGESPTEARGYIHWHIYWQRLIEEETRLIQLLAQESDSEGQNSD